MSPFSQHQKHLQVRVWTGQDTKGTFSFKMGQDQQAEGTKGFICNEITGIGPLEMSLEAQPLI